MKRKELFFALAALSMISLAAGASSTEAPPENYGDSTVLDHDTYGDSLYVRMEWEDYCQGTVCSGPRARNTVNKWEPRGFGLVRFSNTEDDAVSYTPATVNGWVDGYPSDWEYHSMYSNRVCGLYTRDHDSQNSETAAVAYSLGTEVDSTGSFPSVSKSDLHDVDEGNLPTEKTAADILVNKLAQGQGFTYDSGYYGPNEASDTILKSDDFVLEGDLFCGKRPGDVNARWYACTDGNEDVKVAAPDSGEWDWQRCSSTGNWYSTSAPVKPPVESEGECGRSMRGETYTEYSDLTSNEWICYYDSGWEWQRCDHESDGEENVIDGVPYTCESERNPSGMNYDWSRDDSISPEISIQPPNRIEDESVHGDGRVEKGEAVEYSVEVDDDTGITGWNWYMGDEEVDGRNPTYTFDDLNPVYRDVRVQALSHGDVVARDTATIQVMTGNVVRYVDELSPVKEETELAKIIEPDVDTIEADVTIDSGKTGLQEGSYDVKIDGQTVAENLEYSLDTAESQTHSIEFDASELSRGETLFFQAEENGETLDMYNHNVIRIPEQDLPEPEPAVDVTTEDQTATVDVTPTGTPEEMDRSDYTWYYRVKNASESWSDAGNEQHFNPPRTQIDFDSGGEKAVRVKMEQGSGSETETFTAEDTFEVESSSQDGDDSDDSDSDSSDSDDSEQESAECKPVDRSPIEAEADMESIIEVDSEGNILNPEDPELQVTITNTGDSTYTGSFNTWIADDVFRCDEWNSFQDRVFFTETKSLNVEPGETQELTAKMVVEPGNEFDADSITAPVEDILHVSFTVHDNGVKTGGIIHTHKFSVRDDSSDDSDDSDSGDDSSDDDSSDDSDDDSSDDNSDSGDDDSSDDSSDDSDDSDSSDDSDDSDDDSSDDDSDSDDDSSDDDSSDDSDDDSSDDSSLEEPTEERPIVARISPRNPDTHETVTLEYRMTEELANEGVQLSVVDPDGDQYLQTTLTQEVGAYDITSPERGWRAGEWDIQLSTESGLLASLLGDEEGIEEGISVQGMERFNNWRGYCRNIGYGDGETLGLDEAEACIENDIADRCFQPNGNPSECQSVSQSVCSDLYNNQYYAPEGQCLNSDQIERIRNNQQRQPR
jgi:hypothetical protein